MQTQYHSTSERTLGEIVTLVGLLAFLGIAAIGGGVTMMADPSGSTLGMDTELLDRVPLVDDYFVPGILLTLLLGVFPLIVLAGLLWRFPMPGTAALERRLGFEWPVLAAVVQGLGVVVWIVLQLVWLPEAAAIQWVTMAVGVLIVVFAMLPAVRQRYRIGT